MKKFLPEPGTHVDAHGREAGPVAVASRHADPAEIKTRLLIDERMFQEISQAGFR
jgi:hypothetical protein